MFKILWNHLIGFVNITVEGFFVERFVNTCLQQKIFLWKIKRKSSTLLTANINLKDFKKIHSIARKTKCKVTIDEKKGIPFLLHRYRKRKLLSILAFPIFLAILISSQFVWNIEIQGTEHITTEELKMALEEEGLAIGKRKYAIDTKKVMNAIRLKREDIAWMSIDMKGTNITVNIVEAEKKPAMIDESLNCNIIAKQEGLIVKITADRGTALVQKGDIVKKGDLLIGGYMEGKYTETRNVHAKGEVLAKVWHTQKIRSGTTRDISKETGNQKSKNVIFFNNFKINLYKTLPNFQNYDTIKKKKQLKLFQNFYLPISIETTTYIEKQTDKITYGKEELKSILLQELELKFREEGSSQWQITNKVVNFYEPEENVMEAEMTYEVIENIGEEATLQ